MHKYSFIIFWLQTNNNLISKFTAKYYAKFAVVWHNNLMASIYENVVIKPTYNHNILEI